MITYSYNLINLVTTDFLEDRPNLVTYVWAEVTATDDQSRSKTVSYNFSLMPGDTFTPFEQLTESQVRSWIDSQTERWELIRAELAQLLAEEAGQPQFQPQMPPWVNDPVDVLVTATVVSTSTGDVFSLAVRNQVIEVLTELGLYNGN